MVWPASSWFFVLGLLLITLDSSTVSIDTWELGSGIGIILFVATCLAAGSSVLLPVVMAADPDYLHRSMSDPSLPPGRANQRQNRRMKHRRHDTSAMPYLYDVAGQCNLRITVTNCSTPGSHSTTIIVDNACDRWHFRSQGPSVAIAKSAAALDAVDFIESHDIVGPDGYQDRQVSPVTILEELAARFRFPVAYKRPALQPSDGRCITISVEGFLSEGIGNSFREAKAHAADQMLVQLHQSLNKHHPNAQASITEDRGPETPVCDDLGSESYASGTTPHDGSHHDENDEGEDDDIDEQEGRGAICKLLQRPRCTRQR